MDDLGRRFEDDFAAMRRDAYRTAFGVLYDPQLAEDAASEALAQAWLHWSRIGAAEHRAAWIRRVTLNASFRMLRKRRGWDWLEDRMPAGFDEQAALRVTLSGALLRLPRRQREAVALCFLADLSEAQAAAALGVSVNSVKTHIRRGLTTLRSRIEAGEVNPGVAAVLA